MHEIARLWHQLITYKGTASRKEFWAICLSVTLISVLLILIIAATATATQEGVAILVYGGIGILAVGLANMALMIPVSMRRCRDTGLPGRYYLYALSAFLLMSLLPYVSVVAFPVWLGMSLWLAFAPTNYVDLRS